MRRENAQNVKVTKNWTIPRARLLRIPASVAGIDLYITATAGPACGLFRPQAGGYRKLAIDIPADPG